ncbi:MAG TPA: ATP-binding protein [Polyangiaceae bacterium]|nr:ATP-binding protein [Polyangiaceae bacterium]
MRASGVTPSDPAAPVLLSGLARVEDRADAARRIAAWLGADELVILVRDPKIDALLPAPGFPQTLRGGITWREFLKRAVVPGAHRAEVELPLGTVRAAVARVTGDGLAFVVLGGTPDHHKLAALAESAPLLVALVHAENRVRAAEGEANVARAMGRRASELANALDGARSDLQRAFEDAAKLNAELQENNRRKDEFLAMLGHELRNPMAAIAGALEVMRRAQDASAAARAQAIIDRQAGQLARLVDDLLDVSRVSQGKIVLRPVVVNVATIVQNAVETTRSVTSARGHRVAIDVEPGLFVTGDAARLEQMVTNLLTNAARYTDPGGDIRITARREGRENAITVEDNGIGIPPEMLSSIFDPFVQVAPAIDRPTGGLGIGLTLVKRLTELHQGRVEARSERGRGSAFTLFLPATAALESTKDADAAPLPSPVATSKRVLVVDDNSDSGEMLVELMKTWGHDAAHVGDGPAALLAVAERVPDIVLLDIGLPGMDGFEVAARLRATPATRGTRIIALSGYGQEEDRKRSRAAGCDDHLVKPVDIKQLARTLEA